MTSKEALEILFASYHYDGNYQEVIEAREKLEQDLEKLEKIEKWVNDKLDYLNNDIFLVADDYLKGAIRILLELKEVLNNAKD